MLNQKLARHALTCAAVLIGISIPSLFLGRAVIGITLGLALIAILLGADHKKTWSAFSSLLDKQLRYLGIILIGASAINIPFSLDPQLSAEAWARTWLLLGAIFYVVVAIREHFNTVLISTTISITAILILNAVSILELSKLVSNGYLLTLPLIAYFTSRSSNKKTWLLLLGILFLFVFSAFSSNSKASLAGILLILTGCFSLYCIERFSTKIILPALGVMILSILGALYQWLPNIMYATSTQYSDLAVFPVWLIDLHRQLIWEVAFKIFAQSPFVGFGLNASNYHPIAEQSIGVIFGSPFNTIQGLAEVTAIPSHPHNWIMEMLVDGGLTIAIPVILTVVFIFIQNIKQYLTHPCTSRMALLAINIGYWGTGLLNFSFWSTWWQVSYFLTIAIALLLVRQELATDHD